MAFIYTTYENLHLNLKGIRLRNFTLKLTPQLHGPDLILTFHGSPYLLGRVGGGWARGGQQKEG